MYRGIFEEGGGLEQLIRAYSEGRVKNNQGCNRGKGSTKRINSS